MVKYIIAALTLGLAGALTWGFYEAGKAEVAQTRLEATEADLEASRATVATLEAAAKRRTQVGRAQAEARAKATATVRAERAELDLNEEARPTGTPAQLAGLRDLAETGNAAVRAASELP